MRLIIKEKCDELCLLVEDGKKIYDVVLPSVKKGLSIELDFKGVKVFSSSFFHAALGDMLEHISYEDFTRLIIVSNLHDSGKMMLDNVLKDSMNYYSDEKYRSALDSVLKNLSEE